MVTFSLVSGLVLLFVGGEALVRGAVGTARSFDVSPLLIGVTVVAMATSAPELVVSIQAALADRPAIAVGNVVGSNIANILLILGVAALIAVLPCQRTMVIRDGSIMTAGGALLVALGFWGVIEFWHGLVMLGLLVGILFYTYRSEQKAHNGAAVVHESEAEEVPSPPGGTWGAVGILVVGLIMLVVGAELLIYGATETARSFGVSEAVIGLSLVAVGTSLPELASVAIAAWRNHPDVALGNVIGSNIFNSFGILGATALTLPVEIEPKFTDDLWIMLATLVGLMLVMLVSARITRLHGGVMLAAYAGYIGWLYTAT